jgi:RNA polymerase sigma-70 factor (ECF subfamily)
VVEQNLMASASSERGKFRSFILVALNRYIIDQIRRENTRSRTPDGKLVDLHEAEILSAESAEPSEPFNLAWAREVIAQASRRMQAECEASGRSDLWRLMCRRILSPYASATDAHPLGESADRCEGVSAGRESNLLITAKRAFARALRAVVGEYAADEQAIDEEIHDLKRALAGGGA